MKRVVVDGKEEDAGPAANKGSASGMEVQLLGRGVFIMCIAHRVHDGACMFLVFCPGVLII